MQINAKLIKAFTENPDEGNPAGVILNANNLTDEQMLRISADLGFSESAFVQKSESADFRIRFFTSTQEVDLCGHATIATFHTLLEEGIIKTKEDNVTKIQESKAGLLPVTIYKDGLIVMTQKDPEYSEPAKDKNEVVQLLGLNATDLIEEYPIQSVSTGTSKLIIPIKSRELLFSINPDLDGIANYCKENNRKGFYPFTLDTIDPDSDFHARQFNPLAGINEDPITGVAAGALGAYATEHNLLPKNKFTIEQGYVMQKPGKIFVKIEESVKVGGYAVTFGEKIINI